MKNEKNEKADVTVFVENNSILDRLLRDQSNPQTMAVLDRFKDAVDGVKKGQETIAQLEKEISHNSGQRTIIEEQLKSSAMDLTYDERLLLLSTRRQFDSKIREGRDLLLDYKDNFLPGAIEREKATRASAEQALREVLFPVRNDVCRQLQGLIDRADVLIATYASACRKFDGSSGLTVTAFSLKIDRCSMELRQIIRLARSSGTVAEGPLEDS